MAAELWGVGWADAPAWSAGRGAVCGGGLQVLDPGGECVGAGLSGQVQQQGGQVSQLGQVCRRTGRLPEHENGLACEGGVDARLGREDHR